MPRTRNISACFVSIETINVTIRHPLLVDTSLCSYRSLLNLVVRSPAEHRSWCPGSQSPAPHNRSLSPHYPAALITDGGGKTTTKRTFLFWLDTGMSVCRCGFVRLPAPGSGYSYLGSVVESIVDISINNISTQSMNLLQ